MIGILTFYWADDYGGMLQAYALKRQLELLGEAAEIVPYAPFRLTGRYWLFPLCAELRGEGLRYYIHRYMAKYNLRRGGGFWRQRSRMSWFRRKYLTDRLPVRSAGKLSLEKYRIVFVGSDQVWNPDITACLDDAYIGNIPGREECRLISYGASLGGKRFSEAEERKFVRYVKEFAAVSLREQADAVYVEKLLGRKAYDVLDPVLLLDRQEWERVAKLPEESGYILIYLTEYCEPLLRCARALSKQLGKKIISLSKDTLLTENPDDESSFQDIELQNYGGPPEFLGYIQNAGCVLTNSFHATAFSILLEKRFLTYRHGNRSVRLEDLLRKLGISGHLTNTDQLEAARETWAGTDWKAVRARLEREREKSKQFIMEGI